jgi:hypothetical protein
MRQMVRFALATSWLLVSIAVVARPQEQIDRSRNPSEQGLLLPQPRHVSLLVVGDDGTPLSQVHVEHANLKDDLFTDQNGKVEFNTSAPYFVLSRPGYESVRLATKDTAVYRAALHKLPGGEQLRVCTDAELSARAPGWNGVFQIPQGKETKATTEKFDVDFFSRVISAGSGSKRLWVEQGRGVMWFGLFEDSDVWKATRYRGVTYKLGDLQIIDAKVWLPNGQCLRSVGFFGESIVYYNLNCDAAQPLDDLIDQACVVPDALKRLLP